jgi:hypothetical protein
MTILLAMYGLRTFAKASTAVPAIVLVPPLLDSMQDACSVFNLATSPCWVRGALHCLPRGALQGSEKSGDISCAGI